MKKTALTTLGKRPLRVAKGLASAAVVLSLTACGGDTLDGIQQDLANGEDVSINLSTNDDGDLVISLDGDDAGSDAGDNAGSDAGDDDSDAGAGDDADASASAGMYRISVTNLTTGQPMTPPVVALHDPGTHLFQIGSAASPEVQAIAENGNNMPLVELAGSLDTVSAAGVAFVDPANPGPFFPGETASVTLDTAAAGQVLSIVNMVVCTNDGFSGTDSHALPTGSEPLVFDAVAYDAGTEVNELNADYWVPPCGGSGENLHTDENGVTGPHPGQTGTGDFDFDGSAPVVRIEVERVESTAGTYEVSFTNLSTGQPMTPPVAAIHDPSVSLFQIGTPASTELQEIAENGNNDPMVALAGSLAEVSAAGLGFVDASNPGPVFPGETATLKLTTDATAQVFSAVAMVVCTNDGFTGTNSHALPGAGESISFDVLPYDAGTEVNILDADYWVPPCGGSGENLRTNEGGVTGAHPGQTGVGNFDFDGTDGIMRIEIKRH